MELETVKYTILVCDYPFYAIGIFNSKEEANHYLEEKEFGHDSSVIQIRGE